MPVPTTRQQFKEYCLRRLGYPVIEINVDDDQLEDRIDEALLYWQDYHYDGTNKVYVIHQITQEDIDNQYLTLPSNIIAVTNVFPLDDSQSNINMFDLRYQLRLNELYDFTSASYVNFTLTMQHLRTLELLFTGRIPIQFNRHTNILYIDWAWGSEVTVLDTAIFETYQVLDPEIYPDGWNDRWLKQYATALFKRQWGENVRKYEEIQLPGGIRLNGEKIYQSAIKEIAELEAKIITDYSLPVDFLVG